MCHKEGFLMTPRWVDVFLFLSKSRIFFSKAKKTCKAWSPTLFLSCAEIFCETVEQFFKKRLVLGLFKWIGGARFRFFSLRKKEKRKRTLKQSPAVVIFFQTSGLNFKSVLNFIYTRVLFYSGPKFFKCQMIAIEKSSPSCVFFSSLHPLSFVLYMYSDAILYGMLYLYTGPSIFFVIIFFNVMYSRSSPVFLFVSMSVSVTFPSQAKG